MGSDLNKVPALLQMFSHLLCLQVSILDTGEVCMELLKSQNGQERVKEVLRISCDGSMVRSHVAHFTACRFS